MEIDRIWTDRVRADRFWTGFDMAIFRSELQ
jgi:hypothetical protein